VRHLLAFSILILVAVRAVSANAEEAKAGPPALSVVVARHELPSGLAYYDIATGDGAQAKSGQTVVVHYAGWLDDGTRFDGSRERGKPFGFKLGSGQVIAGWEEGVGTMRVGGKRRLIVPAPLAYGERGVGGVIPPKARLTFDIELLRIIDE